MLAMTTCRRWILLLVTGSAIVTILADPNTADSAKAAPTNGWIYPPDEQEVPGVEPLQGAVSRSESSKEKIPIATIGSDVSKHDFIPPGENKKLSTTGKVKYDAKYAKELPSTVTFKSDPSIEVIPSTVATTSNNDVQVSPALAPSVEIAGKVNRENRTNSGQTEGRSLHGNDAGVVDLRTDTPNSLHVNITDLSDVSMDYDDKEIEGGEYLASKNASGINRGPPAMVVAGTMCTYGNKTYSPGTEIRRDCEDRCVCGDNGKLVNCQPLCVAPFIRAGRGIQDSLCQEKLILDEPCCAALVCAEDSEPEPEESCYLGNNTVARGDTIEDGCSKVCICEARGILKCRPRCPPSNSTSMSMATSSANQRDKCVPVPDPKDACCTITLCDVTLGDLDQFKPDILPAEVHVNLTKVEALNSTAIKLAFSNNLTSEYITIELSTDNLLWREQRLNKDGIVGNLEPSHTYYVRMADVAGHRPGTSLRVTLPSESSPVPTTTTTSGNKGNDTELSAEVCNHRGKAYKVGAEWYDECISFCTCSIVGNVPKTECATIQCPTDFGLDVLDPNCLDWEWVPADFVPIPPRCCSQEVRCRNNGSCLYQGEMYNNWSEIPSNVTGCEKRCYCELGNVSCQSACPPVPALPPPNLQCPPSHASLMHLPEDECCLHWACGSPSSASLPTNIGRNGTSTYPGPLATDSINQLQSIDDRKTPAGISGSGNLQQWAGVQGLTDRYATIPRRKYHESSDLDSSNYPDVTDDHGQIHYPMDPGHPTPPPYHGPYDPNFKPTQPSIEDVFRLTPRTHIKTNLPQASKDRPESKTESKKPIEPAKPIKDTATVGETHVDHAIITGKETNLLPFSPKLDWNKTVPSSAPLGNTGVQYKPHATRAPSLYETNYTSSNQPTQDKYKIFPPHNGGESVVPHFLFHHEHDGPLPGPVRYKDTLPYPATAVSTTGPELPNAVSPREHQNNNLAPREPPATLNRGYEAKPQRPPQPPAHVYLGNFGPSSSRPGQGVVADHNDHELPEELYRLINLQHPGLIRLNDDPPKGHQGLYSNIHRGPEAEEHEAIDHVNNMQHPGSLQYFNPQIFSEKGENYEGTGGYQIHRGPGIPGEAHQQIAELLLRVGEKDPNIGPFQHYPAGRQPAGHKQPIIGPPRVVIPHMPQNSGRITPLNHPFAGTTMIHDMHSLSGPDHGLPPGFPIHGGPGQGIHSSSDQVTVQTLEALSENRVRLVFTVPRVLVGLHGRVEVRYTNEEKNFDPKTWKSQIFAPPDDLIATPQLEFELGDLAAATEYKVMVTVKLRDLSNSPTSKIYSVVTLEAPITDVVTLPPQIPTDPELIVAEINSTWANIVWRKFTEYELEFIDGVQLRYKETEGKVYAATPLIHRAVTSYVIENLKPAVTYEVRIYFIPLPGQTTELVSEKPINFTTNAEPDPYSFDIKVEIKGIKSTEVEVAWKGVPYPEDKYVNIYRAIYQSDTGKEDTSTFKIAKRDSPAKTLIGDLKPGTRYRLWIEVYLTNGRIKKSNVQDFVTKPGVLSSAGVLQQGKLAAQVPLHDGDYYGPLVIVAIVASLAILSTLILLMMLMKRRTSSKADISPRKTTAAYDNPSYKTCENAATMDNGQKMESVINQCGNEHPYIRSPQIDIPH